MKTCDPLKHIMDNLILLALICMRKSIRIQRVKAYSELQLGNIARNPVFGVLACSATDTSLNSAIWFVASVVINV